jgi:hypothetical protein
MLQLGILFIHLAKSAPERHLFIITPSIIFFNDFTRVRFEMVNLVNLVNNFSIWMEITF